MTDNDGGLRKAGGILTEIIMIMLLCQSFVFGVFAFAGLGKTMLISEFLFTTVLAAILGRVDKRLSFPPGFLAAGLGRELKPGEDLRSDSMRYDEFTGENGSGIFKNRRFMFVFSIILGDIILAGVLLRPFFNIPVMEISYALAAFVLPLFFAGVFEQKGRATAGFNVVAVYLGAAGFAKGVDALLDMGEIRRNPVKLFENIFSLGGLISGPVFFLWELSMDYLIGRGDLAKEKARIFREVAGSHNRVSYLKGALLYLVQMAVANVDYAKRCPGASKLMKLWAMDMVVRDDAQDISEDDPQAGNNIFHKPASEAETIILGLYPHPGELCGACAFCLKYSSVDPLGRYRVDRPLITVKAKDGGDEEKQTGIREQKWFINRWDEFSQSGVPAEFETLLQGGRGLSPEEKQAELTRVFIRGSDAKRSAGSVEAEEYFRSGFKNAYFEPDVVWLSYPLQGRQAMVRIARDYFIDYLTDTRKLRSFFGDGMRVDILFDRREIRYIRRELEFYRGHPEFQRFIDDLVSGDMELTLSTINKLEKMLENLDLKEFSTWFLVAALGIDNSAAQKRAQEVLNHLFSGRPSFFPYLKKTRIAKLGEAIGFRDMVVYLKQAVEEEVSAQLAVGNNYTSDVKYYDLNVESIGKGNFRLTMPKSSVPIIAERGIVHFAVHVRITKGGPWQWLEEKEANSIIFCQRDLRGKLFRQFWPAYMGVHAPETYDENGFDVRGLIRYSGRKCKDGKPRALLGNFQTALDDMGRLRKRGYEFDSYYMMPVYELPEPETAFGLAPEATTASIFSPKNWWKINKDLGGIKGFKRLIAKSKKEFKINIITDIIPHVNRDARHLPEFALVKTINDKDGMAELRFATDGSNNEWDHSPVEWHDSIMLNFRDKRVMDRFIALLLWQARMGVKGVRIDVAHHFGNVLPVRDFDNFGHRLNNKQRLFGWITAMDRKETGGFKIINYRNLEEANPFLMYMVSEITKIYPDFIFIGENYSDYKQIIKSGVISMDSGLHDRMVHVSRHGHSTQVALNGHLYYLYNDLPEGAQVVSTLVTHDYPTDMDRWNVFGPCRIEAPLWTWLLTSEGALQVCYEQEEGRVHVIMADRVDCSDFEEALRQRFYAHQDFQQKFRIRYPVYFDGTIRFFQEHPVCCAKNKYVYITGDDRIFGIARWNSEEAVIMIANFGPDTRSYQVNMESLKGFFLDSQGTHYRMSEYLRGSEYAFSPESLRAVEVTLGPDLAAVIHIRPMKNTVEASSRETGLSCGIIYIDSSLSPVSTKNLSKAGEVTSGVGSNAGRDGGGTENFGFLAGVRIWGGARKAVKLGLILAGIYFRTGPPVVLSGIYYLSERIISLFLSILAIQIFSNLILSIPAVIQKTSTVQCLSSDPLNKEYRVGIRNSVKALAWSGHLYKIRITDGLDARYYAPAVDKRNDGGGRERVDRPLITVKAKDGGFSSIRAVREGTVDEAIRESVIRFAARPDMAEPFIILVAGKSASGKTTQVSEKFKEYYMKHGIESLIISQDGYYKGAGFMRKHGYANWDDPIAVGLDELKADIKRLRELRPGGSIEIPNYTILPLEPGDEPAERRKPLQKRYARVYIIEGLFTLTDEVAMEGDYNVFVEVSILGQFIRRLVRDVLKGRSMQDIGDAIKQFFGQVVPSQQEFVDPGKKNADMVIINDYKEGEEPRQTGMFETQVKVSVDNILGWERKLVASGAKKLHSVEHYDTYYSSKDREMVARGEALRIRLARRSGGEKVAITATYKSPVIETETVPGMPDFVRHKSIFKIDKFRGEFISYFDKFFTILFVLETSRAVYELEGLKIHLDEIKGMGTFLEIAADDPADAAKIERLLVKLGVSREKIIKKSYFDLRLLTDTDPNSSVLAAERPAKTEARKAGPKEIKPSTGEYFYSKTLGCYAGRRPLKVDMRVIKAAEELRIPLKWNDEGYIIDLSRNEAMLLLRRMGSFGLTPAEYWKLLRDAQEAGDKDMESDLLSELPEWLDVHFFQENGGHFMIEHPEIARSEDGTFSCEGEKKWIRNMPAARPGWFNPSGNIDGQGVPLLVVPHYIPGITGWKFWDIRTEYLLTGLGGIRGYVTSSDTTSLDLGIPSNARYSMLFIRECCYQLPQPPLHSGILKDAASYMNAYQDAFSGKISYDDFYRGSRGFLDFLNREFIPGTGDDFLSSQEKKMYEVRERFSDMLGILRILALKDRDRAYLDEIDDTARALFRTQARGFFLDDFRLFLSTRKQALEDALNNNMPVVFVMGHKNPDTDTVISALFEAYRDYIINGANIVYVPVVQGHYIPDEVRELTGDAVAATILLSGDELYLAVSAQGRARWILVDQNKEPDVQKFVVDIVDHHKVSDIARKQDVVKTFELSGSTTALVCQKLYGLGAGVDRSLARILYGAALMDTENRSQSKMTPKDAWIMDILKEISGIENDKDFYQGLMSKLLSTKDALSLFGRDYKEDWGFGFSVAKVKGLFDDKGKAYDPGLLERLTKSAKENNGKKNLPLTLVKVVDYLQDNETVNRERIYLIFSPTASAAFREAMFTLIHRTLDYFYPSRKYPGYTITESRGGDGYIEFWGVSKQISRKKIAPFLEPVAAVFNEYFYSPSAKLFVKRDFLKDNAEVSSASGRLGIRLSSDKEGRVNNITYYDAMRLLDSLGFTAMTLREYWQILRDAETTNDQQMIRSLKEAFVEYLYTVFEYSGEGELYYILERPGIEKTSSGFKFRTAAGVKEPVIVPKGVPGIIIASDISPDTGLPAQVRSPDPAQVPAGQEPWRYWGIPSGWKSATFVRSFINLMGWPALDGKEARIDGESLFGFPKLGIRPCCRELKDPQVSVELVESEKDGPKVVKDVRVTILKEGKKEVILASEVFAGKSKENDGGISSSDVSALFWNNCYVGNEGEKQGFFPYSRKQQKRGLGGDYPELRYFGIKYFEERISPKNIWLNVGGGFSVPFDLLRKKLGHKGPALNIDISQVAVDEANKLGINSVCGDAQELTKFLPAEIKPGEIELITAAFVFEYLVSPEKAFAEIYKTLKEGGVAVLRFHYPGSFAMENVAEWVLMAKECIGMDEMSPEAGAALTVLERGLKNVSLFEKWISLLKEAGFQVLEAKEVEIPRRESFFFETREKAFSGIVVRKPRSSEFDGGSEESIGESPLVLCNDEKSFLKKIHEIVPEVQLTDAALQESAREVNSSMKNTLADWGFEESVFLPWINYVTPQGSIFAIARAALGAMKQSYETQCINKEESSRRKIALIDALWEAVGLRYFYASDGFNPFVIENSEGAQGINCIGYTLLAGLIFSSIGFKVYVVYRTSHIFVLIEISPEESERVFFDQKRNSDSICWKDEYAAHYEVSIEEGQIGLKGLAHISRGRILYMQSEFELSLEELQRGMALLPHFVSGWGTIADIYYALGAREKALETMNKALDMLAYPDSQDAANIRATLLLDLNLVKEAGQVFNNALYLNPRDGFLLANKALLCKEQGDFKEALRLFNRVLKTPFAYYIRKRVFLDKADCFFRLKKYTKARRNYQSALRMFMKKGVSYDSSSADVYMDLGICNFRLGNAKEALLNLDKALSFCFYPGALLWKAEVLFSMGMPGEAEKIYEQVILSNLHDSLVAEAYFGKGKVLDALSRWQEAEQCYKKVIELRPYLWIAQESEKALSNRAGVPVSQNGGFTISREGHDGGRDEAGGGAARNTGRLSRDLRAEGMMRAIGRLLGNFTAGQALAHGFLLLGCPHYFYAVEMFDLQNHSFVPDAIRGAHGWDKGFNYTKLFDSNMLCQELPAILSRQAVRNGSRIEVLPWTYLLVMFFDPQDVYDKIEMPEMRDTSLGWPQKRKILTEQGYITEMTARLSQAEKDKKSADGGREEAFLAGETFAGKSHEKDGGESSTVKPLAVFLHMGKLTSAENRAVSRFETRYSVVLVEIFSAVGFIASFKEANADQKAALIVIDIHSARDNIVNMIARVFGSSLPRGVFTPVVKIVPCILQYSPRISRAIDVPVMRGELNKEMSRNFKSVVDYYRRIDDYVYDAVNKIKDGGYAMEEQLKEAIEEFSSYYAAAGADIDPVKAEEMLQTIIELRRSGAVRLALNDGMLRRFIPAITAVSRMANGKLSAFALEAFENVLVMSDWAEVSEEALRYVVENSLTGELSDALRNRDDAALRSIILALRDIAYNLNKKIFPSLPSLLGALAAILEDMRSQLIYPEDAALLHTIRDTIIAFRTAIEDVPEYETAGTFTLKDVRE
ncbi:MAG: tetratricopeptide repeat protein, partial [Candidatus Omnitrophota bacterium]